MHYVRTRIDRDALTDLSAIIQAGLAVRALARANPAATSPDSLLRFGESYGGSAGEFINTVLGYAEREHRLAQRLRRWRGAVARRNGAAARAARSDSSEAPSHESRVGSNESDVPSDQSRTGDSECDAARRESHAEDSRSDPRTNPSDGGSHSSCLEDSAFDLRPHPPGGEQQDARQHVHVSGRVARLPSFYTLAPLGLTCPHCGYGGEMTFNGEAPCYFWGFRAQELLNVYHRIAGAAKHQFGGTSLLADLDSFEIDTMEDAHTTNVQCGNCFDTFPSLHPLRFV
jgi:hypothetical protein